MAASILLSTLVGTWVGVKLLGIARRTGKAPELLIGAALLSYAAFAQTSLFATRLLGPEADLFLRMGLSAFRIAAYYLTLVGLAAFAWRVFGPESRWRAAIFWGVTVSGAVTAATLTDATWDQLSAGIGASAWRRLGTTPHYIVAFGWMAIESLRYWGGMRRRVALGLADPVVTNRFLLWGAGSGVSSIIVFVLFCLTLSRGQITIGDALSAWLVTTAGLVNTVVWWLTFMPPQAYTRRVRSHGVQSAH